LKCAQLKAIPVEGIVSEAGVAEVPALGSVPASAGRGVEGQIEGA